MAHRASTQELLNTVPTTNSSKSEKVILCLILIWLAPYRSRWLKWWLHPLNCTFKLGLYFSPTVSPAVRAEVELALEDQQHWSGDALLQHQGKVQLIFILLVCTIALKWTNPVGHVQGKSTNSPSQPCWGQDPALPKEGLSGCPKACTDLTNLAPLRATYQL